MAQNFTDGSRFIQYYGEQLINQGVEMYKQHYSLREIERRLGINRQGFSKYLMLIGVKTTTGNHFKKYYHNFDYFEIIDTPEKAYWLGFIYADGYITNSQIYGEDSLGISLAENDKTHLEKFKKSIKATNPINVYKSYNTNYSTIQGTCRILLRSQKTVDDLIKLGCFYNKSLLLKFPSEEQVKKEFQLPFILGYLDGDGSICYNSKSDSYSISICGTENMVSSIRDVLGSGGNIFPEKRNAGKTWYYTIGGNLQVLKILSKLYQSSPIHMDRKYIRFQNLQNKYA